MAIQDDYAFSRRQLRRARIQDVLTMGREGVVVGLHRDRLLEPLTVESVAPSAGFNVLDENSVDMVVSVAIAEVDESAIDALNVLLLCINALAKDGQFARVTLLADRLYNSVRAIETERPFLTAAVQAFSRVINNQKRNALLTLNEILGLSDAGVTRRVQKDTRQIGDILAANVLRRLIEGSGDEYVTRARAAAASAMDGTCLNFIDAALAWNSATAAARPIDVLTSADSTFRAPELRDYVRRRQIPALYPAQITAIAQGATLDDNCVVSLPTSSGKTLIGEFRVAAALHRHPGGTAIYVAPYRLLARQVEREFRKGLWRRLGHSVRDLGSGYEIDQSETEFPSVVIATPERLDALLRLATSGREGSASANNLFSECRVLIFDELQLVGRPGRGHRFELVLTRLRSMFPELPILGLSAASLGTDELADWFGAGAPISGATRPTGTLEILWENDGKLLQRVSRRPPTTVASLPRKSSAMDDAVKLILQLDDALRPVLAVCVSRQNAESLARKLLAANPHVGTQWRDSLDEAKMSVVASAIEETRLLLGAQHPLATCMERGIAFHHAGVPTPILQQIEHLAAKRLLRIVCATTTVAEGADLPFRVVVIPHLNFPGHTRKLERDLYLNIIGRAGRANVSVEGIVFILNSKADTLRDLVRTSLWSTSAQDRVRGQLPAISAQPRDLDSWREFQELQSQLMGWLGDGSSYIDDQADTFSQMTFSYHSGSRLDRSLVKSAVSDALAALETDGYALAASPFQLTERGHAARLAGLSPASVSRLEQSIARGRDGWMKDLVAVSELSIDACRQIASILFDTLEVFEHSLWARRLAGTTDGAKLQSILRFTNQSLTYQDTAEFGYDIDLFSMWMRGESYLELSRHAPMYKHSASLFGGDSEPKRTSDATEYIGKLSYPARWAWSAIQVLAGDLGREIPSFIGNAIEYGLPSEASTQLTRLGFLTRPGSLVVAQHFGHAWVDTRERISNDDVTEILSGQLTSLDFDRLIELRERLLIED
ncbi:DEAD/DEAH box helicase [Mycobacterium sp. pW049]|uniref:DEAD/DEAH box helicase n=1 Tax=[Mycobacterium] bulgaricum TaxID=3238985 RepID=UPI00351B8902